MYHDLCNQFEFPTVDSDIFDKMTDTVKPMTELRFNYCPECEIPMDMTRSEYNCNQCGRIMQYTGDINKDNDEIVSGTIRITTGANKGRFYNITSDYTKTQMKIIVSQLMKNQMHYKRMAIPINILTAAATQYNQIQKHIREDDYDDEGNVIGQKKFVRRGNIKDETLAALIYFEGIREKIIRKKRDIATFMNLPTNGFSRGEDILRNLHAEGHIDIPVDEEPISGYVSRYMDGLNIDNDVYSAFVIDLVQRSEDLKIGMNSQLSSKIVGAIWVLINKCKLKITYQALETATDNTKRNTFIKFYKLVTKHISTFKHIFEKHHIPC